MEHQAEEYQYRVSLVRNLTYDEADSRLAGLWEWLNSQSEMKSVIDATIAKSKAADLLKPSQSRRGGQSPKASTPEEIAGIGFLLLKEISDGSQAFQLGHKYGISPPFSTNRHQDYYVQVFERFISPSLEFLNRKVCDKTSKTVALGSSVIQPNYPLEITDSLKHFFRDHPDPRRTAFIMMQFGTTPGHSQMLDAIRSSLKTFGITGLRADDKEYHDDLFPNVQTYMHGCGFGIAIFERLQSDDFNPNVSLEVGYMRALRKPVCLMKDQTLRTLQTDLVGKLYKSFDPQRASESIPNELTKWLHDREIVT
ncbi:MAG: hypothetical protein ACK5FS_15980 [Planctomycetota bacterium]|jgi:hypothetical protein